MTLGVVFAATACAAAQTGPDLPGVYLCAGTNPDGQPYEAVVEIAQEGEVWALRWTFEPHGQAVGVGVLRGETLAVIYQTESGVIGLVAYTLERDGPELRLVWQWTVPGLPRLLTETLTKTSVRNPALLRGPRVGV